MKIRTIRKNRLLCSLLLFGWQYSYACLSPVGIWYGKDSYGEMRMVFNQNGTGKFFPDIEKAQYEETAWRFLNKQQKQNINKTNPAEDTNVLEVTFLPSKGDKRVIEYMLCSGNHIIGQLSGDDQPYIYKYRRADTGTHKGNHVE